jgi:hypothetical protein
LRFYTNLQTVTAIAVFCENIINASRVEKEAVKLVILVIAKTK